MTFQAKRLRVQLPCADTSLVDEVGPVVPATFCPLPSRIPVAAIPTCRGGTIAGHDEFETVVVSPEQLTVMRRQLDARLALVKGAEQALARNSAIETEADDV